MAKKLTVLAVGALAMAVSGLAYTQDQAPQRDAAAPNAQEDIVSGIVTGEGTEFAVRNNAYPNFKLTSSDRVNLAISVSGKAIVYSISKAGKSSNVEIVISGLPEGFKLFRHVGDRPAERPLTVKDGVIRYREEIGKKSHDMLTVARSTRYVNQNLTLTEDLVDSIVVTADSITIDGAGHALRSDGVSTGVGIWIAGHTGVTVKDLTISGFERSIYLSGTQGTTVQNCVLEPIGLGGGLQSVDSRNESFVGTTTTVRWNGFAFRRVANETIKECTFIYPEVPEGWPPADNSRSSAIVGEDMDNSIIQGNTIDASAHLDYGIVITLPDISTLPEGYWENDGTDVIGNRVSGATYAVGLTSVKGTVRDNTLFSVMRLRGNTQVTVFHNDFEGAATPKVVTLTHPPDTTELSSEGSGNFWGRSSWPYWTPGDTDDTALVDSFAYGAQDGWLDAVAPSAPTLLPADGSAHLSWTAATDEGTGVGAYRIERKIGDGIVFSVIDTISAASCRYSDANVEAGKTYSYRICAIDRGRNVGPSSEEVSITFPAGPTNLAAIDSTSSSITWSWDSVPGATSYVILRADDETFKGSVDAPATVFIEKGLPENTRQSRHVKAVLPTGPSAPSNNATGLTRVHDARLSDFTALFATAGSIRIAVTSPLNPYDGSTGVRVERTSDNVHWTPIKINGQEFSHDYSVTDNDISTSSSYIYRIRFRNAEGFEAGDSPPMAVSLVPTLLAPGQGSATNSPRPPFDWSDAPVDGAVTYTIGIANADTNTETVFPQLGVSEFTPAENLAEGAYRWRVQASFGAVVGPWSAISDFSIDLTVPGAPVLRSPLPGGYATAQPTLDWDAVTDASGVTYRLQVDDASGFASPDVDVANIAGSTYRMPAPLADKTWYWRVMATDQAGNQGPWSASRSFRIDSKAPDAPVLSAPSDGAVVNTPKPSFSWNPVNDPTVTYRLQVAAEATFTAPLVIDTITGTAVIFSPTADLAEGSYVWRVIAIDGAGNTSTSVTRAFALSARVPIISLDSARKTNDKRPEIKGTCGQDATILVRFSDGSCGEATASGGTWTYRPEGDKPDGTYIVTATSRVNGVESPHSNAVRVTVDTKCAPPTDVTATALGEQIRISWTASPDADVIGYEVLRDGIKIHNRLVAGTQYIDTPPDAGVEHSYRVRAVDDTIQEVLPQP